MNFKNFHFSDISIPCLIKAVLRDIWMVVAAALILSMTVSMYFNTLRAPVYQGTMTYAVSSRRTSYLSNGNATAANEVAAVLSEMLGTTMVRTNIRQIRTSNRNKNQFHIRQICMFPCYSLVICYHLWFSHVSKKTHFKRVLFIQFLNEFFVFINQQKFTIRVCKKSSYKSTSRLPCTDYCYLIHESIPSPSKVLSFL